MNTVIKHAAQLCTLFACLLSFHPVVLAEPITSPESQFAADNVGKILDKSGFKIAAGAVPALEHLLDNWEKIKNPCPCTIKLLEAMFRGLRDNEGQSFAFVITDCFDVPQLGSSTFAQLQDQGEYLSNELARNKTQNLATLKRMIAELRAKCNPPSTALPPPPPVTGGAGVTAPPPSTTGTPPPPLVTTPLPPPVVTPPPPPPAPPPQPEWSVDNPCPPCQEWADLLARERANLDKVMKELADLQNKLPPLAEQQRKLQNAIKSLEAQIASQEGTGGSSFDPETGITITAITEASGDVRVTTRDANGNIIEEHTRERRDTSKIKAEIKAKEAEIQKLKDQEAQIQKDIDYNNKLKEKTERAIKTAQEGLEECIKTKCNPPTETALVESSPQVALVTDGAQTIVEEPRTETAITEPGTPRETVPGTASTDTSTGAAIECPKPAANEAIQVGANSEVGSGARAVEKAKETAGGILGGLIGDSLPFGIGGGGGSSEPETVKDTVPDDKKQTFTAPDGTAIKLGGMMTPEGMLVSSAIESSPGDGTFQTIFLENSQGQRAGPLKYLVYEMYQDWSLTVSWTHDRYVDGQHVSHEEGGWSEGGTNFLGSFKVPQAGEGIWSQMGFGNAVKGIKSLGTMYPLTQEQLTTSPTNVVVHVTRPKADPVLTTPFIFWAMVMADGGLSFQQANQTYAQMDCGKLPKPGGGMQQIDPPASGPPESEGSILDDIDDVPVIAN